MTKKEIRENFRKEVYKRDKYTCHVCGIKKEETELNAHHIVDRSEMPNGGYVKENGITVCEKDCHFKVEKFHIYNGEIWEDGLNPNDLFDKIGSNYDEAFNKSINLK